MPVPVEQITPERLERWGKRLIALHSTPLLIVAIGHDHVSGQLNILTCEEMSDYDMCNLLRVALAALERRCAD